jgi:hypothetical protein
MAESRAVVRRTARRHQPCAAWDSSEAVPSALRMPVSPSVNVHGAISVSVHGPHVKPGYGNGAEPRPGSSTWHAGIPTPPAREQIAATDVVGDSCRPALPAHRRPRETSLPMNTQHLGPEDTVATRSAHSRHSATRHPCEDEAARKDLRFTSTEAGRRHTARAGRSSLPLPEKASRSEKRRKLIDGQVGTSIVQRGTAKTEHQ